MNDYYEVKLELKPMPGEDATDYLAALLGDIGFESFVPDASGVTAYVPSRLWDKARLDEVLCDFPFDCDIQSKILFVEGKDWNEEWERNYFQPIVVADKCVVRSSFHTDYPKAQYEIVIDPKMAFGTGHHSTTSLIIEQLVATDLEDRAVTDMGTGTGILAILAAMRGASPVTGIEIDEFAFENAKDNVAINGHGEIELILGDASSLKEVVNADIFIANINRNVITADIGKYAEKLKSGGKMFLSGFYVEDIPLVEEAARKFNLETEGFTQKENWACLRLLKS